jgi:bifunctional isochorismate lyase/aryl carrier protein
MGIPLISPYAMPTGAEVPPSVAAWLPDPHRAALLIHDMQNYFVDFFPPGRAPVTDLCTNITRLRRAAAAHGVPVVYSAQPGRMSRHERGLLHDLWGPGMGADPACREIVVELAPGPGDVVVTKRRYSAFHCTELGTVLAEGGRNQLLICGVYAHVGCLLTACDAFARDIETFLIADAVADFSAEHHRMALQYAATRCAVTLATNDVLSSLTPLRAAREGGRTRAGQGARAS